MKGSRKSSRRNGGAKGRQPGTGVSAHSSGDPVDLDEERQHSRVIHSGEYKETRGESRRRRWRRRWIASVTIVLVVAAITVLLRMVPILTVSSFSVKGNGHTPQSAVIAASGIKTGQNMTRVDTRSAAVHILDLPWITEATVNRSWPGTVSITVKETAVAFYVEDHGDHLFDSDGREFDVSPHPRGALKLNGGMPSNGDTARGVAAVAQAVGEHAPDLIDRIDHIEAQNENDISLVFKDSRKVNWGSGNNAASKAEATKVVLRRDGKEWNISNPTQVAVKG
ncbi:cell division protein FtsQ/DivIB [Corynebacterium kroppenstedtii]|uniref:cell division protein FtsQ/DivIB n=1 Tax=Corynebacterium sp. PCR 32 TaxID=3351342 RepID=UPI0030A5DEB5